MRLCHLRTKLGKLAMMYVCVGGTDLNHFVSIYDFYIVFWRCPNVWYFFYIFLYSITTYTLYHFSISTNSKLKNTTGTDNSTYYIDQYTVYRYGRGDFLIVSCPFWGNNIAFSSVYEMFVFQLNVILTTFLIGNFSRGVVAFLFF